MTHYITNSIGLRPIAFALIGLMITFVGCNKLIDIDLPIDQLTTKTVFADSASAESAVVGLYSRMSYDNANSIFNGLGAICPALSADELRRVSELQQETEFMDNTILSTNVTNYTIWRTAYSHVYHINSLLEQLTLSTAIGETYRSQLLGEVRFLRGLLYFYLTNFYGAVPLALHTDYRINGLLPRTASDAIYEQIIADLSYAESTLKPQYPTTSRTRLNKWAAATLLARVHLYRGEWDAAERYASAVIGSGTYHLEALEGIFKANSRETIWQFHPAVVTLINSKEGSIFIPASNSVLPNYALTDHLLDAFAVNDMRRQVWVSESTVGGISYPYPYKYRVRLGANNTDKSECTVVLRLAELYLIRAEALAQQGMLDHALADLDQVRQRAGLARLAEVNPAIDRADLLDAIFQERQVELFTEWGHRWFDLKRTGRAATVLGPIKAGFSQGALLYPVPQHDRLVNPFLDQNEGYE